MTNPWMPICTRGNFDARVLSAGRLREMGLDDEAPHQFVLLGLAHGESEPFTVGFTSLDAVSRFVADMEPRKLLVEVAKVGDIDSAELIALLRAGTLRH